MSNFKENGMIRIRTAPAILGDDCGIAGLKEFRITNLDGQLISPKEFPSAYEGRIFQLVEKRSIEGGEKAK